jgi:rhodanese-related sulfurtransferase
MDKISLVIAIAFIIVIIVSIFIIPPESYENVQIQNYYSSEVVVSISPTDYLRQMKSGEDPGLAVDLRSAPEYNVSHLVTSINIPAGSMDETELVAAFNKLPKDRTIITYCYSSYCMLSRKVGNVLTQHGIYVKHFTAGWLEIKRDYNEFVSYGPESGKLNVNVVSGSCNINDSGEFGC